MSSRSKKKREARKKMQNRMSAAEELRAAPGPKPDTLWHYTSMEALSSIMTDGFLRRGKSIAGIRRVLWFSSNPVWERSSAKTALTIFGEERIATLEEQAAVIGAVRIGVPFALAPHPWREFRQTGGWTPKLADHLESYGINAMGANPDEWYVSYKDVPISKWETIEAWHKGRWTGFEEILQDHGEALDEDLRDDDLDDLCDEVEGPDDIASDE